MDEETTNLVEGEAAPETEVENEVETEIELDDDGNPIEASEPEDEFEEVERDGRKLKVAKELAAELMMQADYTRKTQELAEQRKALDVERQTVEQATQAELQAQAQVIAIDGRLQEYANIDWDAWESQDPFAAQKGWREFQQLQTARGHAAQSFHQLKHERTSAAQLERAKRVEEGAAVLAKEIPGWSQELGAKLLDYGVKSFGFTRAEIEDFEDPRMVKVLHAAFEAEKSKTQQRKVETQAKALSVQPAAKVAGATAKPAGLDDRLSADEWLRRRNEQLRKRG